jgi:predicted metal-dependent peptidase
MWQMPFYDIMLLYNAYADYCDEENKHHEEQQARYEEQVQEQQSNFNMNSIKQNMPKMPDLSSLTRGFTNNSGLKF